MCLVFNYRAALRYSWVPSTALPPHQAPVAVEAAVGSEAGQGDGFRGVSVRGVDTDEQPCGADEPAFAFCGDGALSLVSPSPKFWRGFGSKSVQEFTV
jgi:hypothetical protein